MTGASAGGRLFIAIDVGDAVRAEVTRVVAQLGGKLEAVKTPPKVTWVKPAALHVTLRFLGETDDVEAERVRAALTPAIALPPFDVEWRGLGAFPSPRHPRAARNMAKPWANWWRPTTASAGSIPKARKRSGS